MSLNREFLKTNRSLIKDILFSFLTFGIYSIYMIHATAKEVNISCEEDGKNTPGLLLYIILSFLTLGIYPIFWYFSVANRMDEQLKSANQTSHISGVGYLCWSIFGSLLFGIGSLVARHKFLSNLNKVNKLYNKNFENKQEDNSNKQKQELEEKKEVNEIDDIEENTVSKNDVRDKGDKIFSIISIGLVLAFVAAFLLWAILNVEIQWLNFEPSETFTGKLSDNTYSTIEESVCAYIDREINGISTKSSYKSFECLGAINETERGLLNLSQEESEQIDQIEKVKVSYEYKGQTYTTEIYACYLQNDAFKYFVPAAKTGEVLTKSYFDSVMDPEKYTNYTMERKVTAGVGFFGIKIKQTAENTIKVVNETGYLYQSIEALGSSNVLEIYLKNSNAGLKPVARQIMVLNAEGIKWLNNIFHFIEDETDLEEVESQTTDTGWRTDWQIRTTLGALNSLDELFRIGFPGDIDHTFFVKTKSGFAVNPEKQEDFTKAMIAGAAALEGVSFESAKEIYELGEWSFDGAYYVSEGRLAKSVLKREIDFSNINVREAFGENTPDIVVELYKHYCVESSEETLFVDFGVTEFQIPEEVNNLFK